MKKMITRLSLVVSLLMAASVAPMLMAEEGAPKAETKVEKKAPKKAFELTQEQREQMAKHHEEMAACLRSTKTWEECHEEMFHSCQHALGGSRNCPMVGAGLMQQKGRGR